MHDGHLKRVTQCIEGFCRARSEEAEVSLEYLQSLHSKHEKWFIESAFDDAGKCFLWSVYFPIAYSYGGCSFQLKHILAGM